MSYYFTEYTLTVDEDTEIHELYTIIKEEAVNEAMKRGAHQFKLWLPELDVTIYAPVSVVVSYANHDRGKYFVPATFWVGENN
jgi:hypothetical protein